MTAVYACVALIGLAAGSFLNVVIARLPSGEDIVVTRSHCPACGRKLRWYDLIPVLSFCILRGRCRDCKEKISYRYPLVELLTAVLYVLVVWRFGFSARTVLYLLFVSALIAAAFIDGMTRRIPNAITLFVLVTGLLHLTITEDKLQMLIGAAAVSMPLFVLYLLSKGSLIGLGDVKLFVGAGLMLGWQKTLLAFGLACVIASVIHLLRMRFFHAGRELALGPYLSVGLILALLAGDEILYRIYGVGI